VPANCFEWKWGDLASRLLPSRRVFLSFLPPSGNFWKAISQNTIGRRDLLSTNVLMFGTNHEMNFALKMYCYFLAENDQKRPLSALNQSIKKERHMKPPTFWGIKHDAKSTEQVDNRLFFQ
jgi:hypothetical protein